MMCYAQESYFVGSWIQYNMGHIFTYNEETDETDILFSLPTDSLMGYTPYDRFIEKYGYLYGTTYYGGVNKNSSGWGIPKEGVIFCINLATGEATKLHDFALPVDGLTYGGWPNGDIVEYNGKIYGTAFWSGIWSYDLLDSTFKMEFNLRYRGDSFLGTTPPSGLTLYQDKLYGVNQEGGIYGLLSPGGDPFYNDGTLYSYDPNYHDFQKLLDYRNDMIGTDPRYKPVIIDDYVYGATSGSKLDLTNEINERLSTLYRCNINDSSFQVLVKFEELYPDQDYLSPSELFLFQEKIIGAEYLSNTIFILDPKNPTNIEIIDPEIDFNSFHGVNGENLYLSNRSNYTQPAFFYKYNVVTKSKKLLNLNETDFPDGKIFSLGISFISIKDHQTLAEINGDSSIDLAKDSTITFSSASSAGLEIVFKSDDPAHITFNGGKAYFPHTGEFVITAIQEGNDQYYAALPKRKTVHVYDSRDSIEANITGIKSSANVNLTVYPNPTDQLFNLTLTTGINKVDGEGKTGLSLQLDAKPGVYIIQVQDLHGGIHMGRLVLIK